MDLLPVFFDVKGKWIAVIGGGGAALRRVEASLKSGARVRLFAGVLSDEFKAVEGVERLQVVTREASKGDLDDCALLFCAADDAEINRQGRALATGARVPCNVVDTPELCDFTMPSIIDRSPVVIAVSTSGTSPILGRMVKARIETMLPAAYGQIANFLGRYRSKVADTISDGRGRRRFWERVLESTVVDLVLSGKKDQAAAEFEAELGVAAIGAASPRQGEVYLVGAGPGDPDLLTFKALRLMQRADVVLYDRLVGEGILDQVRRDAERIYVGKQPQDHTLPQDEISRLMLRLAKEGKRVLRLKGGDPFMFGRGGEEIELLAEAGIPFQVVPGVTAALGCSAYAGIPLTHRDHAHTCVFVTGHGKDGKIDLDWNLLIQPRQTVAVYMGLAQLQALTETFVRKGADPMLPAAVVDKGTRPGQTVITSTVSGIADKVAKAALKGPAILIVGTVVRLREKLDWYYAENAAKK